MVSGLKSREEGHCTRIVEGGCASGDNYGCGDRCYAPFQQLIFELVPAVQLLQVVGWLSVLNRNGVDRW